MSKNKKIYIILLVLVGTMYMIDFLLFGRLGIYVDEYGIGPSTVWGSDFWNYMSWLLYFMLLGTTLFLTYLVFKREE